MTLDNNNNWQQAINIFHERIDKRFLLPIKVLQSHDSKKQPTFGFSILAIDCLLIETLISFIHGLKDTIGQSKNRFIQFLVEQQPFSNFFDSITAGIFYDDFRCGILHQAEIQQNSIIRTTRSISLMEYVSSINQMRINRNKFHEGLIEAFEKYKKDLFDVTQVTLRKNFIIKMNFICDYK